MKHEELCKKMYVSFREVYYEDREDVRFGEMSGSGFRSGGVFGCGAERCGVVRWDVSG